MAASSRKTPLTQWLREERLGQGQQKTDGRVDRVTCCQLLHVQYLVT
jgi:hypothetical protein